MTRSLTNRLRRLERQMNSGQQTGVLLQKPGETFDDTVQRYRDQGKCDGKGGVLVFPEPLSMEQFLADAEARSAVVDITDDPAF